MESNTRQPRPHLSRSLIHSVQFFEGLSGVRGCVQDRGRKAEEVPAQLRVTVVNNPANKRKSAPGYVLQKKHRAP